MLILERWWCCNVMAYRECCTSIGFIESEFCGICSRIHYIRLREGILKYFFLDSRIKSCHSLKLDRVQFFLKICQIKLLMIRSLKWRSKNEFLTTPLLSYLPSSTQTISRGTLMCCSFTVKLIQNRNFLRFSLVKKTLES